MAGIGFELRRLLRRDSYLGLLEAYGYAGLISSGPWVLSIIGVLLIGLMSLGTTGDRGEVVQFLVSVTWLMAGSLILTGILQLLFTRFIADRLFEKKSDVVVPNLMGALTLTSLAAMLIGVPVILFGFQATPIYELSLLTTFVVLCDIWIVVVFLTGMKAYRVILLVFVVGYATSVLAALFLAGQGAGLAGLMFGFLSGQALLLFLILWLVIRQYPGERFVEYRFLRRGQVYWSLAGTGLFYNLAIWADKFMFWFNPATSEPVIGPFRASLIYDIPIFLAYLSIIPGMAVFLVRIETDFAEIYDRFYDSVREGDTLQHIRLYKQRMVQIVRQGIYEIFKIQGMTVVILFLLGPHILDALGISRLYLTLFSIDLVAVGVQVLLLAILNVLFYLDRLWTAFAICLLFLASNIIFTWLTLLAGPEFYGLGFAAAVIVASLVGLALLSRQLARLEYETFMLQ